MERVNLIVTSFFEKEYRRLLKKYKSLESDLTDLSALLRENPELGTSLGGGVYKIRIAIKSKGKGKRGGGRVITWVVRNDNDLFLLTIYDKSEQASVSDAMINALVKAARDEAKNRSNE